MIIMYRNVSFIYKREHIYDIFVTAYPVSEKEVHYVITGLAYKCLKPIFIWELSYRNVNSAIKCVEAIAEEYPAK